MKTFDLQEEKKLRLHLGLKLRKDFETEFNWTIHQTVRFNNFKLFFGKQWLHANFVFDLFLENSFANFSNSIFYVTNWNWNMKAWATFYFAFAITFNCTWIRAWNSSVCLILLERCICTGFSTDSSNEWFAAANNLLIYNCDLKTWKKKVKKKPENERLNLKNRFFAVFPNFFKSWMSWLS